MKLIDGKKIAERIEEEIKTKITPPNPPLHKGGKGAVAGLAVILIGDNPESHLYVRLKEAAAKRVGIYFEKHLFEETVSEQEIIKKINELNAKKNITGIIVQLPLPEKFDTNKIIHTILPTKDADGYHPENLIAFQKNKFDFLPPVLCAVLEILKELNVDIKTKSFNLLTKSEIFPIPYIAYFKNRAKEFHFCSENATDVCLLSGDIVITAIGKKHYLKSEMIKKGAIVIDIGAIKKGKNVYGDADPISLAKKASYLTPTPGGVGPITVACLLKNVAKA
ncbi:bifunctional 5,10-methylenetetrahydrofolate dehydrogenase/5,10-methenyltetrahydrofolate cyclohydrolase [Candidatus Parcubacteria bacterium]|nr:bifunctional 5,10-methylenetetrahydrofolate dehydrogenase/5,10-methenyltetrahydrofolate cyclohydrolase [Patescibacteria group bacterium]MCG2694383.1 bifunctional 5,10-methylenetetrahydrofolate dehydrogenase/5,10-methenyltetrahydrofolate cyclohydrolase [Candidatus Parcubacteria bacterium]